MFYEEALPDAVSASELWSCTVILTAITLSTDYQTTSGSDAVGVLTPSLLTVGVQMCTTPTFYRLGSMAFNL